MDVDAACLIEYSSVGDLSGIFSCREYPRPFFHIGGGSNLLFTGDFGGTILHSGISFIEYAAADAEGASVAVRAGAGVDWDGFCAWCASEGLWGAENLSLIPGEVGAAAVQNIGAYGSEVKDIIRNVECYDVEEDRLVTIPAADCRYAYRESFFKNEGKGRYIVTAVNFALTREYSPKLDYAHLQDSAVSEYGEETVRDRRLTPEMVRSLIIKVRKNKLPDPEEIGSAGSFFRNPYVTVEEYSRITVLAAQEGLGPVPHFQAGDLVKIPAAWMIDKCGWKGFAHDNVGVYGKQPLVIVNLTGRAAPEEILRLERRIVASVREKFGVDLVPEVEHVGEAR